MKILTQNSSHCGIAQGNRIRRADFIKIRSNDTSAIQWAARKNVHQGVWVDIFPLDSIPSIDDQEHQRNFEIGVELFYSIIHPEIMQSALDNNDNVAVGRDELKRILALPFKERALIYGSHMEKSYFDSERIGSFLSLSRNWRRILEREWYASAERLPFEEITIPAPIGYDDALKVSYGDWRKMVVSAGHLKSYSSDIPYTEYFHKVK